MPRFLIDRNFSKITEDELAGFAKDSKRIARDRFHDVTWHHSHVVIDPDGVVHTFCVYSAPDEARTRRGRTPACGQETSLADEAAPAQR